MRHLFIVDPLPLLNVEKDTTIAFMRAAARRGHEVFSVEVGQLDVGEGGRPIGVAVPTKLREGEPWYELGTPLFMPLHEFDVVWMRKDPPYDIDYFFVTHVLSLVSPPTLVVNDPQGLREVSEKFFALRFPDICPESLVSRRIDELLAFRDKLGGEMVIKPLGGAGGDGVFHLTPNDRNVHAILETATRQGREYQLAQRYIPEIRQGDKRIILLEDQPIGAVLRVPHHTETRANLHVGGEAVKTELTQRDREICARIGPALVEAGILFSGIDVIGDWLTEVNVTSPTGVREINALEGVALEELVLDAVERRWQERRDRDA
ncbi:MAG: glutathione synthase [Deltaproteobacteria bacterium]|nr:glutathione synthase [Myxococcales bacterium]MCZ6571074.1 glutathione synthase [Deltaproteobacteria bacterium]TDJ01315.1 MAG: glutathione synthase [Deltaproteobacteria bacterium]TDJ09842.1 MAG: glutathione synthase [Deltaproteobacteria bacterium]